MVSGMYVIHNIFDSIKSITGGRRVLHSLHGLSQRYLPQSRPEINIGNNSAETTTSSIMATLAATFNAADKSTPGHYGPSQTALLLLDFHSMFVQQVGGPKAAPALEVAAKIRTWAKSQGIQVIHCLIDTNSRPFPTCKGAERIAGVIAGMRSSGSGEESAGLLEDSGDDITFIRRLGHVSALRSPGLEDFLQKQGIKSLVLTGLSTSGCVLRTAITASDAEYVATVISDGCADPDEGVHDIMLGKVLNNRGYVTTSAEFQEGFVKATR